MLLTNRPQATANIARLLTFALCAGGALASVPPSAAEASERSSAARTNAAEQALLQRPINLDALGWAAQPSVVADPDRQRFVLSWQARLADGCTALQVATLSPAGELGEVREASRGCDWFVNWADHPSLAIADNGDWLTFWLVKEGAGTYAYGIRVSRSTDDGRSWSAPITPHDDGTQTEHGFVSMAPAGGDRMLLAWLDGRNTASASSASSAEHAGHHGHAGAMSLRSAVIDRSGQLDAAVELDARVCDCCSTDLVRSGPEQHHLVFRDRSAEEIRDTGLARRDGDSWQLTGTVHDDGWKIAGCPVNGPAIAFSAGHLLAAWSTMPDEATLAVRARLIGGGAPIVVEQGAEVLGRVDAAGFDGGWLLSWLGGGATGESVLRLGRVGAALELIERIDVVTLPAGRGIGAPRLAALERAALLIWTGLDEATPALPRSQGGGASRTRLEALLIRTEASSADPDAARGQVDHTRRAPAASEAYAGSPIASDPPMAPSAHATPPSHEPPAIIHNPAASRFEALVDGQLSVIDYRLEGTTLLLPSVRVPRPVEGRGIAAALTRTALDWARGQSLRVVPICPYVSAWITRHPDYQNLVAAADGTAP